MSARPMPERRAERRTATRSAFTRPGSVSRSRALPAPPLGRVAREADLVQIERGERVAAEQRDRLGAEALPPLVLPPDDDAERRVAVDGVDLVEPAVPDVDAALAGHDGERLVTARV